MNLPNKLTIARLFMAMIFVILMSKPHVCTYATAYVLFVAAALTDYFDGKIARKRNLVTNFGKLMDPLADKVLMLAGFIMLLTIPALRIPAWTIVAIFAREFLVTGARSLAAAEGSVIAANNWGKAKTIAQMSYVIFFLFLLTLLEALDTFPTLAEASPVALDSLTPVVGIASRYAIILVALFTVYTGIQFAWTNWNNLQLSKTL